MAESLIRDDVDGAERPPTPKRISGALSSRPEETAITEGKELSPQGEGRGTSSRASVDSKSGGSFRVPALRTIRNGLKLKAEVDSQPNSSISFTYAFSSFTEKPLHIDWKIIVNNEDIESQHIRCHALQPGDKIKDLISLFKKALAKAVVLINTQDNYTLAPELTEGMERGGFPIVVLMKIDGEQLVEFLEKFYEHDVLARLDIVGSTDTQQAQALQQQSTVTQVEESATAAAATASPTGKTTPPQDVRQGEDPLSSSSSPSTSRKKKGDPLTSSSSPSNSGKKMKDTLSSSSSSPSTSRKKTQPPDRDDTDGAGKSPIPTRRKSGALSGRREEETTFGGGDGGGLIMAAGESTQGGGRGTSTRASVDSTGGGSVPVPAPRTIRNGLKLKAEVDGQTNPSISFTYAFSSFTEKPLHIDWKIIVNNEDIESQHIRCHALQPGDKIKDLISSFKKALAKAVVLINTQDNYTLAPELTEGMERGGFPIVVLKKSNGEELVEFLEKYYEHDVLARLDTVSSTDTQQAQALQQSTVTQVEESVTFNKLKGIITGSETTGFQRFKQALGFIPKPGTDLKYVLRRLMFTNDKEPIPVSNDEARFKMVMSVFTNYEKQAIPDSNHSDVVDVLRKLKQHLNECFLSDIPLYLVLSYRLHITYSLYDCDELRGFITGCIDKFESLEPKKMTTAISTFLEKDDFEITFLGSIGTDCVYTHIFFLMETACVELAQVSYNIHRRLADTQKAQTSMAQGIQKAFCPGFVYSRMLWTTLTLKLHDERRVSVTRITANLWRDHLVKYSSRVVLDLNAIREVKRGLELGRLLELPPDVSFNHLHMKDFLVGGGKTVRPLAHVETYFRAVESYIPLEADLADFLANIRANYHLWIRDGTSGKVATASVEGTLLATIKEGIAFVDTMNDICSRRKVDPTLVESDGIKWVLLLLLLVDFTSDKAEIYIKQFVHSRSKVLKGLKCRQEVKKYIRDTTRANFPRLTIQKFDALFKAFKIYSQCIVEEFLRIYIVQQEVRINDPTWHSFIGEVVLRFGGARNHFFLLDFLRSVADSYLLDNRQREFISDLMQLNVPKLFAIEEGADEATEKEDMEVGKEFTIFLRNYINRNALKLSILSQMTSLLRSISEADNDDFQDLILGVLKKEVIPEFMVQQGSETAVSENFHVVLQGAVSTLCKDLTWIKAPTRKQNFCWGLVASCCSKINITQHDLDWVHCYSKVLNQVGYIFNVYCSGKKLTESQCVIIEKLPDEIAAHPSEDVRRYIQWVRDIQTVMKEWEHRSMYQRATYDQMMLYGSNHTHLHSLGNTLCVSSLVCDAQDLHQMKTQFLTEFEALNVSLIKYLPDQPDVKWCTLPALLQEYGVSFPRKLQEKISKYILFPGDKKSLGWEAPMNLMLPNTTGEFQPGHEVSLQLSRYVRLYQLAELVTELGNFQQPLIGHLEMLVFFKLNKSVMFDKYLRVQIRHNTERLDSFKPQSIQPSSQFSGFQFSVLIPSLASVLPPSCRDGSEEEGVPITVFIRSLESTRDLLSKVTQGDAKYSEIIAEGALDLENLDVKREFAMLVEYSNMIRLPCNSLSGVQSMLELFQYSMHINNINNVCMQYKLKGCLDDPKLEKLKVLVGELVSSEDARANITPNEALKKMQEVKATLDVTDCMCSKCLDLFTLIQGSALFYQFVRDKRFYGNLGIDKFKQQYELITDQLQHEEYDEVVMHHLYAAFKLMTPFMDRRQDLGTLMSKVLELDVTNGLRQLETVNANITLIRLWFSRAEELVDSLKKEKEELLEMKQQLQGEVERLEDRVSTLSLENKSFVEENQSLGINIQAINQDRDILLQINRSLQEDNSSLHQQVSTLQGENCQLSHAQQESVAFGVEPWKVSRDKVEVIKVIGGGGWGAVSEGKLRVAIKQFYPTILSASSVARLKREMEMLARIRHPNLVQFIGVVFEEHDNVIENPPFIVTELLDISLRVAYENKQVPPENLCPIFQDTARALDYLHRRHEPIIHRDVSSANVLLKRLPNGPWMAKVSDLGSANLARDAVTRNEGAIIYCAPEAFTDDGDTRSGESLTPKVDVYSYGIMLCEVATSTLPIKRVFPSLVNLVLQEWPKLHHLITICIKRDPEQRPTMEEVLSALTEIS